MAETASRFVWVELATADPAAAKAFYADVAGWTVQEVEMEPGHPYTLLLADGVQVGGLTGLTPEAQAAGATPRWQGYVGVGEVDAKAGEVQRLGGRLLYGPMDIPGVGRFANVTDPQGAAFTLFAAARADEESPARMDAPGHFGWHELNVDDIDAAMDFYRDLLDWREGEEMSLGPLGRYQIFVAGGQAIGGIMKRVAQAPRRHWLHYVNVADIEAATGRARAGGGQIVHGPSPTPGGDLMTIGLDPQGALFGLLGRRAPT